MEYQTNQDYKACPNCGKAIEFYKTVCPHCGQTFEVDIPDERIPYIGSNVNVYLKKFNRMEQKNSILSWNWCGFLLTTRWLMYRKMYGLGVVIYVMFQAAGFVLGFVLAMTGLDGTALDTALVIASMILSVAYCTIVGMLGDHWYKKKIERLAAEGKMIPSGPEKQKHIKKGGTNIVAFIIWVLFIIAIKCLNNMLL